MSCNLLKYIINNILIRNCIFLKRELYKCIIISKVVFLMVFFEKKMCLVRMDGEIVNGYKIII